MIPQIIFCPEDDIVDGIKSADSNKSKDSHIIQLISHYIFSRRFSRQKGTPDSKRPKNPNAKAQMA